MLQPLPLSGTLWELTAYNNGKQAVVSLLAGTKITAFFAADNSLTGSAGCNTYTASYKVNGNQIQIGSAASTMMFCSEPDGVMDQETAYLKALESANTYEIIGDQLTLRTADGATAAMYQAVQPTPLVGTQWQLTAYNNGKGGVVSTVSGSQVTALFSEDGKLTGSAGCNNYTAAYKATGDQIQISQAASTLMMCAEPQGVMEQETAYLQAIGKAATYQIEGDQLTLRGSDGATLASYQASVGTSLENTHWQLTGYNNGKEAVVGVLEGTDVSAVFGADGKLAGSGGCNNYTADYQVDGSSLHIGPAASTRKLCSEPQGVMEQEAAYLKALESAGTYQIQGDKLEIRDANGALLASYQANLLFGTRWDWVETKYGNDTSLAPSEPGKYQLFFLPDEVLDLLADCTAIAGKYTVQGGTMTIDLSNAGNVNCGANSQATQFVRDAQAAASYLIKDGQLYIALKFDTGIMQFTPGQP